MWSALRRVFVMLPVLVFVFDIWEKPRQLICIDKLWIER